MSRWTFLGLHFGTDSDMSVTWTSRIEGTLSMFANDGNPCGVFDTLEGRDGVQRDLDRLERQACANYKKFNRAKCKVLERDLDLVLEGLGSQKHKCRLGGEWIESSHDGKVLWVLMDKKLNISRHCSCRPESQSYPGLHQK
ncbi:rna-directed dna polymerase from mobile element jockey-like [Willisornis vidua]|uniref:Rna-directed dna polymerase from mobile element jockey-like n=1 Tax=Willisornis vidua TaxID=1566151 RepID=A0ABQ9D7S0_9PASS|nr:rna-directed dna polymerase from mobile element jockey-like [Willisornis vidua]